MRPFSPFRLLSLFPVFLLLLGVPLRAETEAELLQKGEPFDLKLQPTEALKYYLPAEKLSPDDPDVLKRIARQYRHLMADASAKTEKLRLGHLSLEYAQRAASDGPADSEAQISPAVSMGKMMPLLSLHEQLEVAPKIKSCADRALAIDTHNDTAWHVLGRWNRVIAGVTGIKRAMATALYGPLPTGTMGDAEKCLQKAISINPQRCIHYLELGRIEALLGKKEEARRNISKGLAMPSTEKDDPEMKTVGREILEGLH